MEGNMANNDEKVLKLKAVLEEKKENLKKADKFTPVTNLSLELHGIRTNLNVAGLDQLAVLLIEMNSYVLSAKDLNMSEPKISGFTPSEWVQDLRGKYMLANRKQEVANIKVMEDKLNSLLSTDKKVELELQEIESLLNG
jgi:hypothetical protein